MMFSTKTVWILLGSLAAAIGLYAYVSHLQDTIVDLQAKLTTATNDNRTNLTVASACKQSVLDLVKAAEKRDGIYTPIIQAAQDNNVKQQSKAAVILATPPTVPTDGCRSAEDRARNWIAGRTK